MASPDLLLETVGKCYANLTVGTETCKNDLPLMDNLCAYVILGHDFH